MVLKYPIHYRINWIRCWNYLDCFIGENMSNIEIFVQVEEDIKELKTVKKVLESAVEKEKLNNVSFNLIIVDNKYIHELNKTYRNIDRETDVITFALEDNEEVDINEHRLLGDIYISVDKAKSQSIEYNHSFKREICFLAVHGFLHLLGYDHMEKEEEKTMFSKQDEILDQANITR